MLTYASYYSSTQWEDPVGVRSIRPLMQIVVNLILMGAALYIMVWQAHDVGSQRWASGTLGAIMSYWLTGRGR